MPQIATASITLKLDLQNFDREFRQVKGAVSQLGSNLKNVGKNLRLDTAPFRAKLKTLTKDIQQVGQRAKAVGQNLSLGLTAPIALLATSAIKAASDLEETQSKFDIVYGNLAKGVREWAGEQAIALGRGQGDIEKYLASLQDLFVPLGFAADGASEMSKQVTGLAIDLASFNNLAEQDVVNSLIAALTGSHETVKKFGVIINQTTLSQELMNMGIYGGVKAANEQEKVQARLNLILKNTSAAQGNAALTAGTFANRMRNLNARIGDIAENFGKLLLPTVTKIVDNLGAVAARFSNLDDGIKKIIIVVSGLAAVVGPLLVGFGVLSTTVLPALVAGFAALTSPIALVVGAVAGAAILIVKNWKTVSDYFTQGGGSEIFTKVKTIAIEAFDLIQSGIEKFVNFAKAIWTEHGEFITSIFQNAFTVVSSIVNIVLDNILGTIRIFSKLFTGDFSGALEALKNMFFSRFQNIAKIVFAVLDSILGGIATWLGQISSIGDEIKSTVDGLRTSTKGFGKDLDNNLTAILRKGVEIESQNKKVGSSFKNIKEKIAQVVNSISNIGGSKLKIQFDGKLAPIELAVIPKAAEFETSFDTGNLPDFGGQTDLDLKANFDVDAIREIAAELEIATNKGLLFGDSFNVVSEQQRILKERMIELLDQGILPQNPAIQELQEKYDGLGASLETPNEELTKIAGNMLNMAAAAIASGESFAVASHKIISAFISQGIAAIIANTLKKQGGQIGALALPIAAVAGATASALFKSAIPKFAKGGIVSGRTLAEVGEYAGASHNPEVIAPLDKLKTILGETGGGGNFNDGGIINAIQNIKPTHVNIDRDGFDVYNEENLARTRYLTKRKSWNSN